ncbi:MAG TPA: hypothetical protein VKV22_07835 [Rhodanobacteraceae bacterium]|nr:hypothetical protein [Rhodanobacteraceae bacterium]
MFDRVLSMRPRVALVFGDAASAAHVRDAVAAQIEIVYATSAAEFDASRLAESGATAALVSLDGCDWLDSIEASLNEAGVAVVFDDPEISRNLQGWERARWLRHLTAKLSGNTHYDPPRPSVDATSVQTAAADAGPKADPLGQPTVNAPDVAERPLSAAEIESMTADFVTVQEPSMAAMNRDDVSGGARSPSSGVAGSGLGELPATTQRAESGLVAVAADSGAASSGSTSASPRRSGVDLDDAGALDVDTEALSAMIDARLAESGGPASSDSPEVWRVVEGGAAAVSGAAVDAANPPEPARPSAAPVDDADVMNGLPALDDWQLVDPEAPAMQVANAGQNRRAEPEVSLDLAGLELVPMETIVPLNVHAEPIERWMHVPAGGKSAAKTSEPAASTSNGGRA